MKRVEGEVRRVELKKESEELGYKSYYCSLSYALLN
jgi:hypothetical protein